MVDADYRIAVLQRLTMDPGWEHIIKPELERRLEILRDQADSELDPRKQAHLLGRIAEVKDLLVWPEAMVAEAHEQMKQDALVKRDQEQYTLDAQVGRGLAVSEHP